MPLQKGLRIHPNRIITHQSLRSGGISCGYTASHPQSPQDRRSTPATLTERPHNWVYPQLNSSSVVVVTKPATSPEFPMNQINHTQLVSLTGWRVGR